MGKCLFLKLFFNQPFLEENAIALSFSACPLPRKTLHAIIRREAGQPCGFILLHYRVSADPAGPTLRIAPVLANPFRADLSGTAELTLDNFLEMQVPVTMELGRNRISIGRALALGQGSIIELDTLVGDDLKIFAGGKLFARGEVVVVNEKFGIKITAFQQATE